ncbi:hypothetical protein [Alloactinosynnema sp. L-07]|nr:hypothetical protein [Alloactinosynnema sp. L-07]
MAFGSAAAIPGQILGKTAATILTLLLLRTTGGESRGVRR